MAFTLFDLILRASDTLGKINEAVATGGSTTTVVDSLQTATRSRFTDDCIDGTMFITYDAGGAGTAPQGEFTKISAFNPGTGTYTLYPALTQAVAAGDTYAWSSQEYPLQRMIGLANEALSRIGLIPLVDTVTLTTDSDQSEYACSVAWKYRPFEVAVQQNSDTSDNQWQKIPNWEYVPSATGSTGLIILDTVPTDNMHIRVKYLAPHPYVSACSSVINEHIEPELAILALQAKALSWNCKRTNGSKPFLVQVWNQAEQEFMARKSAYPTPSFHYPRKSNLMNVGND